MWKMSVFLLNMVDMMMLRNSNEKIMSMTSFIHCCLSVQPIVDLKMNWHQLFFKQTNKKKFITLKLLENV